MTKHNVETAYKNMFRMDDYVRRHVNNEDLVYDTWFLFVPDGGNHLDPDDAMDIAKDITAYVGVCELFSLILVEDLKD